jgi:hypothetical protein
MLRMRIQPDVQTWPGRYLALRRQKSHKGKFITVHCEGSYCSLDEAWKIRKAQAPSDPSQRPLQHMDEQPDTAIGPADDETQIVAKDAETQLGEMAWSQDDSAEPVRHSWESAWGRSSVMAS